MRGLVLAGGKSSRFGSDKALAAFEGASLLERAVDLLEKMDLPPMVVTRAAADYSFLKCPVLRDKLPDKGPLGGLYTALSLVLGTDILVLTCDMPLLDRPHLSLLLEAYRRHGLTTVFRTEYGALQPFPGIYTASLYPLIRERLFQGKLSLLGLLDAVPYKQVIPWRGQPHPFMNVNRPKDLASLAERR
jgi:molybdopterin-guanine dinucleotide biosynthesis protein A